MVRLALLRRRAHAVAERFDPDLNADLNEHQNADLNRPCLNLPFLVVGSAAAAAQPARKLG